MFYVLSGLGLAYAYDQRDWFKLEKKKETFTEQAINVYHQDLNNTS